MAGITFVVSMAMIVLLSSSAPHSVTLDAPELVAPQEHGTSVEVGDLVPGVHAGVCGHHSGNPDCPSCQSCSGIPANGKVMVPARLAEPVSGHTRRLEQAVLRRELPPPRHV